MSFILNYHGRFKGNSGPWGPFSTRGEADFFARQLEPTGVWDIVELKDPNVHLFSETS